MPRYIDADKLDLHLSDYALQESPNWGANDHGNTEAYEAINECIKAIDEQPTADVRENVKGEWLPHPNKDFREWDVCSACGVGCKRREYELGITGMEYMTEYNYPYCPNCGAQMMRGGANEQTH